MNEAALTDLHPEKPSKTNMMLRLLAVMVMILVASEVGSRIEDWIVYDAPPWSAYSSLDDLVVRDADGMHGRPSAQYQKWRLNELGMRGPSLPARTGATLRVVAVGASETFGLMESPGREYPRQLEDSLRARIARKACSALAARQVDVLNAGFAGMSIPTIEQDVRLRLRKVGPDYVVVYPAPVGYLEDALPTAARPDSTSNSSAVPRVRALQPRVIRRFREQLKQALPEFIKTAIRRHQTRRQIALHTVDWRYTSIPEDRLAAFESDLRGLIGTIRKIGAQPVLVAHGNRFVGEGEVDHDMLQSWEKFYPRAAGQTIIAFDSAARVRTFVVARDSSVLAVDASARLSKMPESNFGDFVHFTDEGAAAMADVLSDSLCFGASRR